MKLQEAILAQIETFRALVDAVTQKRQLDELEQHLHIHETVQLVFVFQLEIHCLRQQWLAIEVTLKVRHEKSNPYRRARSCCAASR